MAPDGNEVPGDVEQAPLVQLAIELQLVDAGAIHR